MKWNLSVLKSEREWWKATCAADDWNRIFMNYQSTKSVRSSVAEHFHRPLQVSHNRWRDPIRSYKSKQISRSNTKRWTATGDLYHHISSLNPIKQWIYLWSKCSIWDSRIVCTEKETLFLAKVLRCRRSVISYYLFFDCLFIYMNFEGIISILLEL